MAKKKRKKKSKKEIRLDEKSLRGLLDLEKNLGRLKKLKKKKLKSKSKKRKN